MKFYLKKAFFILVYIVLTSFIAMAVLLIKGEIALKIILLIANLGLFGYIVCGIAYQDGQRAYKVLHSNDKEREYIVKTGEYRKLKVSEEYKAYKGFLIGFISCVPLVVMLLMQFIITQINPLNVSMGETANYLYFFISAFANLDPNGIYEAVIYASPYWSLLSIPPIMIVHGISFILGAKKIERQYQTVKDVHKSIYGE